MKFKVSQESLNKGLQVVTSSLSSKTNLQILSNILIKSEKEGGVKLVSTDLETATLVEISSTVAEAGESTVPARSFIDLVSALSQGDEVEISQEGNQVNLSSSKNQASFASLNPEDFPPMPAIPGTPDCVFDHRRFVEAATKVVLASSVDESRPILTGVLFNFAKDKLELVATDGYRLSYNSIGGEFAKLAGEKIVVPSRTISSLIKITADEAAKLNFWRLKDGRQVIFGVTGVTIVSRIIEGEFPSWERIIPEKFTTNVTVDREELLKAVRLSSVFARDSGNIVKVAVKNQKEAEMILSANTREVGGNNSSLDVEVEGAGGEIAFNFRYLSDILSALGTDKISFAMIESLNPGRFREESGEFFHIIMPVRVQN